MSENFEKKSLSRRDALKGIAAVAAAAAIGGIETSEAKSRKLPPGYEGMVDAAKEVYGIDVEAGERNAYFESFKKIETSIREQYGRAPNEQEYKRAGASFDVYNWNSPEAEKFMKYLKVWKDRK